MKKVINKIKKINTKNKIIIIGSFIIVLVAAIVVLNLGETAASSGTVNIPNQIVDGISFENAVIEYEDGISKFTATVYNENKTTYSLKYVSVSFVDEQGKSTSLKGYIGDELASDAGRKLIVSADDDLSGTVEVIYTIQK